ncbi:hypothetical protein Btru_002171 [Bulinus truncatus]|nr:hypothetical protein Btru_002171 [Bulinus truncatus]
MLGLCWTPAAVQGMQKMATTMPSNPEQLHGAILVRKDIFHRFETTMHDTCLDANNLLEYLFSLYNRKSSGRGHHAYHQQSNMGNMGNAPHLQSPGQVRLSESPRGIQPGVLDGHRKKIKLDPPNFHGNLNYLGQHHEYNQVNALRAFDSYAASGNKNMGPGVKMELNSADLDARHTQSSSPLPPFSQIRRQPGNRPYSPASAPFPDNLATPPHDDGRQNVALNATSECKVDSAIHRPLEGPHVRKAPHGKHGKRSKATQDGGGEHTGRKKRTHQCFCGALFTRADNLKRHIRKCHEEKLEKLNSNPIDFEVDMSSAPITDFQNVFPPSSHESINSSQQPTSDSHEQQQHQQHEQHPHRAEDSIKNASGLKWSCFCGETFEDHRQMLEHTKTHENNT